MPKTPDPEAPNPLDALIDPINIHHDNKYKLIVGADLSLAELSNEDIKYLGFLAMKGIQGMDYFELLRLVRGLGAYPLKGSHFITADIATSVLFRTAEDIVARAGIRQGVLIPPQQMVDKSNSLLTVATVAQILGVTRVAVYQMLQSDRLKSTKYGRTPLIKREDLEQFRASWPGPKRKKSE